MSGLRFILVLLLTVAVDLSTPLPQPGAADAGDGWQESAHATRGRRPFRPVRDTVASPVARESAVVERHEIRHRGVERARRVVSPVVIRKQPPAFSDSSSPSEPH